MTLSGSVLLMVREYFVYNSEEVGGCVLFVC